MADGGDDLDAFLTLLESKLRAPFSSLDLAKTVTTTALTSSSKANAYLENVCSVLHRAEKVTQLRILTGLLGLEPSVETDAAVKRIIGTAQEAPLYEEWVRIVAGIVEGIMFEPTNAGDEPTDGKESAARNGEEARQQLEKTCSEVLDGVRKIERDTSTIDEDTEHRLGQSDVDPTVAPYRYALLNANLLEAVIPEVKRHDHFRINESADILLMDARMELEKAKEEQEHQQAGLIATAGQSMTAKPSDKLSDAPDFPGFQGKKKAATAKARPKSSMFLPSKRTATSSTIKRSLGTRPAGGLKPVQKTGLKARKAGAAQALLGKGRHARLLQSTERDAAATTGGGPGVRASSGATTTTTLRGRAAAIANSRMGNAKSKMKMLDVGEVQGLETKKHEATTAASIPAKRGRKPGSLKRGTRPSGASATTDSAAGEQDRPSKRPAVASPDDDLKPSPIDHTTAAVAPAGVDQDAMAAAVLASYQNQMDTANNPAVAAGQQQQPQHYHHKQQDWRQMLQEKSNRLSPEDRERITHFFLHHAHPDGTVGTDVHRLKLHEDRTTDPRTGEPVKETYYLDLNYATLTSKQSKKTKRYKD